jgi:hypothetical protein
MGEIEYKLLVGFDDELKTKLREKTRDTGISMSQFIRNSIEAHLNPTKAKPSYSEIFWVLVSVAGLIFMLHIY